MDGFNDEGGILVEQKRSIQHLHITMPHPQSEWEDSVIAYRERDKLRWEQKKRNMRSKKKGAI
jgi:hypothetical protein